MIQTPMITAHSGTDNTPDNSLEFVRYALASQADALEVDIQRDPVNGELIITHDEVLTGDYPRLREVFALLAQHPTMRINCDLKPAGLERDVFHLAQEMGVADRLIFSGTVDVSAFEKWPELRDVEIFLNLEEYVDNVYYNYRDIPDFELTAIETICSVCKQHNIQTVNVNYNLVTRRFIQLLAKENLKVSVWTVNGNHEINYFLTRGVYNLTTRKLRNALAVRESLPQK